MGRGSQKVVDKTLTMAVLWLLAFLPAVLGAGLVNHPVVSDFQTVLMALGP